MGTRNEDQPAEHWAGAESLDPTPVWKQYVLIALLLFGGLVAVLIVSLLAIAPQIVTPPALVPGDRLVLFATEAPAVGAPPRRIGAPLVDEARAVWLSQPSKGDVRALRARWSPHVGDVECDVQLTASNSGAPLFSAPCGDRNAMPLFDLTGKPISGAARGLDHYLVSVSDDRMIVNLSRLIQADERVPAPQQP
jgi:hypothetical protein